MDFLRISLIRTSQILLHRVPVCKICIPKLTVGTTGISSEFHTSACRQDLMEFFDSPDDIEKGKKLVVGRPWRIDELRIKSNEDLHKLWYVLLKERNMLLTMEEMYKNEYMEFPKPERIDKVEESMENILDVIKERDIAYNVLETGKTGVHEKYEIRNFLGIPYERTPTEHLVPQQLNKKFRMIHPKYERWMEKYLRRYDEKLRSRDEYNEKAVEKKRQRLLDKFPHLTEEEVEEQIQLHKQYKH